MQGLGKPYSLLKRGRIWYARFKLDSGEFGTAKSTGQTAKGEAERWCLDYLKTGKVVTREGILLKNFAEGFFHWDSPYAMDKRVRNVRISERECRELTQLLNNHILPYLGDYKLTLIDRTKIKEFRNDIFNRDYSASTINKILYALKAILESAEEQGLIQYVPKIDRAGKDAEAKGVLTVDEVKSLFVYSNWKNYRAYAANLLAATSGLRLGEILALQIRDYNPKNKLINVHRSWESSMRKLNSTTKSGKTRTVILPHKVVLVLNRLIALNPYRKENGADAFIFWAEKSSDRPCDFKLLTNHLFKALAIIGIDEQTRKARNISFHSHRHFLNSLLVNAKIPITKIQAVTGHLTPEMTQHYYHVDDMSDVQRAQESVFEVPTV